MAFAVRVKVEVTGDGRFARVAERLRRPRPLLRKVGVLMMSSASGRLTRVLKQGDAVRSGRLAKSIAVGESGRGGADTIFRLSDSAVEVGSNLPYAAQVHFGGTILPKTGKALAIPLLARLKRNRLWPRDLPPDALQFVPAKRGGGVIGFLVNRDRTLDIGGGSSLRFRGRKKSAGGGVRKTALFMLVASVTHRPRPFLFFDDADRREIANLSVEHLES